MPRRCRKRCRAAETASVSLRRAEASGSDGGGRAPASASLPTLAAADGLGAPRASRAGPAVGDAVLRRRGLGRRPSGDAAAPASDGCAGERQVRLFQPESAAARLRPAAAQRPARSTARGADRHDPRLWSHACAAADLRPPIRGRTRRPSGAA